MKIIVLTSTQYKEKDAIVTALTQSETIVFACRGAKDPKSKNSILNNPLTIADIELIEGDFKYPQLKASKEILSPFKLEMNSYYLGTLLLVDEMVLHFFPDDERPHIFPYLEEAVVALKKSNDWLMTLLIFMAHVLRLGGFELEVNRCVICGQKKKILAFSFVEGGFICQDCISPDIERDLTKEQMILLRSIFNSRDYHLLSESYNRDDALVLLARCLDFAQEAFGYRLKNTRLILV